MQNKFFNRKVGKKPISGGKAIYMVILLLLLAACASTAVVSWLSSSSNTPGTDQSNMESKIPPIETLGPDENDLKESSNTLLKNQEEDNKNPEKKANQAPTTKPNEKTVSTEPKKLEKTIYPVFQCPVVGTVLEAFSMDKPVFSKTLQEWRTHSGIDISAEIGTAVSAAAAGEVEYVKNDPRYGVTVIVDHGNNVKTVYANLASELSVVEKQKVKAGDIIGSVGDTAAFESAEDPHLHFEVLANNIPVDPSQRVSFQD